ncbi:MAG: UPF0149 family protein [Thiotrichaceae bacterium]|nr:UPF0149 family protein [Thiotrichaceae bacterium]
MDEIYEPVNTSLQHVGALMDAAETHGILCGLLCSTPAFDNEIWFKHVLSEMAVNDGLASKCQQQLLLVKHYTQEQLNSPNCEFMPLLPSDEISLLERTQALGGWCEGFLFGLGMTGIPDEAKEFIDDLISISRIAPADMNERNEEQYMQLVEYIKIGVINMYISQDNEQN